jgi:hypothetical protein
MTAEKWALLLALAAFIIAIGKFLDDYHISKATKDSARSVLVRIFVWLDDRTVPDLSKPILISMHRLFVARLGRLIAVSIIFSYWATVSALYICRSFFGPSNTRSYIGYLLGGWIPEDGIWFTTAPLVASMAVPAMLGLTFIAYFFHRASLARSKPRCIALLISGVVGSICISLVGSKLAYLYDKLNGSVNYDGTSVLAIASLASVVVPVVFASLTAMLIVCRWCLRLVKLVLLNVFNVASSPEKSPFIYASSLLSVGMLGVKIIQELASSM